MSSGSGQERNRSHIGVFYSQSGAGLFSCGLVQEREGNRTPVRYQISAGYLYDIRDAQKDGHGIVIDLILAPCFTIKDYKCGPYLGLSGSLEVYKKNSSDFMLGEKNFGFISGVYLNGWEHLSLRIGIKKNYYVHNIFNLWNNYPLEFSFSVALTI